MMLENASYLCLDFCGNNAKGNQTLNELKSHKVHGLPDDASQINMPGGSQHRQYTHRGWDDQVNHLTKEEHKRSWEARKDVLRQTAYRIFDHPLHPDFLSWTPLGDSKTEKKYESFCALVYYVHVLGDYLEDDNYKKFNGSNNGRKIAFARPHPSATNIDIFFELEKHLKILFSDNCNTRTYKQLMKDLRTLAKKSRDLSSGSGINSAEKFNQIHKCAEELMDILGGTEEQANRIHKLLMQEDFFRNAFYEAS